MIELFRDDLFLKNHYDIIIISQDESFEKFYFFKYMLYMEGFEKSVINHPRIKLNCNKKILNYFFEFVVSRNLEEFDYLEINSMISFCDEYHLDRFKLFLNRFIHKHSIVFYNYLSLDGTDVEVGDRECQVFNIIKKNDKKKPLTFIDNFVFLEGDFYVTFKTKLKSSTSFIMFGVVNPFCYNELNWLSHNDFGWGFYSYDSNIFHKGVRESYSKIKHQDEIIMYVNLNENFFEFFIKKKSLGKYYGVTGPVCVSFSFLDIGSISYDVHYKNPMIEPSKLETEVSLENYEN
jgi:hypothetical protein